MFFSTFRIFLVLFYLLGMLVIFPIHLATQSSDLIIYRDPARDPPYDSAIPLLGIYPEKTIIQKDTYTPMFIAALFTIARSWKQLKCPQTDEWIKMWYIYTMEHCSAIKSNKIGSFVEKWMDLETVIQSEVSQKEKNQYHILMHICGTQKNGTDEPVCRAETETQTQRTNVWTPRGERGRRWV